MKILAVDTATKSCSVAIVSNNKLLAEETLVSNQTHSKHLMDMINKVIGLSGLTVSDLDGFAVTRGPGSFTGLRIGISSIKGLAAASGKPVVSVSSLEALARQCCFSSYLICPLIDAHRGEVYCSRYRFFRSGLEDGILRRETKEQVLPPGKAVADINEPCLLVGNGALIYIESIIEKLGAIAHFATPGQNTIWASTVADLSMYRFERNDTDDISSLVPYYIRKSDAELSFVKKPILKFPKNNE